VKDLLRFFIGYDEREPIAYHTLCHSILARASCPVSFTPLVQSALRSTGLYTRDRNPLESTAFSFTRFLVPALCNYRGPAIFMDCDFLCRADVAELHNIIDEQRHTAVLCCQHDYQTTQTVKFLGQVNVPYPRKNWSSFMIFNTARCTALTPPRVNILSGLELHRFSWLREDELGTVPLGWNHLVGEYAKNADAQMVHFTLGGPWFKEYETCDYADEWFREAEALLHPQVNAGVPS